MFFQSKLFHFLVLPLSNNFPTKTGKKQMAKKIFFDNLSTRVWHDPRFGHFLYSCLYQFVSFGMKIYWLYSEKNQCFLALKPQQFFPPFNQIFPRFISLVLLLLLVNHPLNNSAPIVLDRQQIENYRRPIQSIGRAFYNSHSSHKNLTMNHRSVSHSLMERIPGIAYKLWMKKIFEVKAHLWKETSFATKGFNFSFMKKHVNWKRTKLRYQF